MRVPNLPDDVLKACWWFLAAAWILIGAGFLADYLIKAYGG